MTTNKPFFGREIEFQNIINFIESNDSGFTYQEGRRRVGKSLLLKKVQKQYPDNCLYFSGLADESDVLTRNRLTKELAILLKQPLLSKMKGLSWQEIFEQILNYLRLNADRKLIFLFDEIQWIAKHNTGFLGQLKVSWLELEDTARIKIIICGSSKRFFQQTAQKKQTDEVVLKRIKTYKLENLKQFSPIEVKKYYFPDWDYEKICFLYMIFGGLPYYLQRIDATKPFLTAINDAVFLKNSIFLDEVKELLNLEFNKTGIETAQQILSNVGQNGMIFSSIQKKTGLAKATLDDALVKLYNYELLFHKKPMNEVLSGVNNTQGIKHYIKDFFLNFYFQHLSRYESRIKLNNNGLIFSALSLDSNSGYYINNFTGQAFELFCQVFFEQFHSNLNLRVFKKLNLRTPEFKVGTYWSKTTQIDLIIEDASDRVSRIIECKWVNTINDYSAYLTEINEKEYIEPQGWNKQKVLIVSQIPTEAFLKKAQENKVTVITLSDFFEE